MVDITTKLASDIGAIVSLSDDELVTISEYFEKRLLSRDEFFLQEGH